jgi:hypothetical protein
MLKNSLLLRKAEAESFDQAGRRSVWESSLPMKNQGWIVYETGKT